MDYAKEFEQYATKHHGINSTYYNQLKLPSSLTPIYYGRTSDEYYAVSMDVFSRLMMDRIIFLRNRN